MTPPDNKDTPALTDGPDRLEVIVLNADLRFGEQALLVGHYRSASLTGAEAVVDVLLDARMSGALNAGLYPSAAGAHQVFGNTCAVVKDDAPCLDAVIVAGLGDEGELRVADLVYTVRQAILAYAQRLSEQPGDAFADGFSLSATLLGSGGSGITAGSSALAIVQGAHEANTRLGQVDGWPRLRQLTLVELYLERATDAWHTLQMQEQADRKLLHLVGKIHFGTGALRRPPDSSYRGTTYDFISALQQPSLDAGHPGIAYTLDTRRARAEVHAHRAQATLVRELVSKASNDPASDPEIGRTLFNLLIPIEMEPFLGGSSEMVMELDAGTAGIPWELLDTSLETDAADKRPWAIRSKLIRKMRQEQFRTNLRPASVGDKVLIIGDPKTASPLYPSLPGARREAIAVAQTLTRPGSGLGADQVTLRADENDAQAILIALLKDPYRIVHIAGHGEPGPQGGVVLSADNTYLGVNEISAMRSIPDLVFLNSCHTAAGDVAAILQPYDRAQFAANVAESLIRIGVRCVVAAGWAVTDDAAETFATAFYVALLNGSRFIEAVGIARSAAWNGYPDSNTWAAYQCYGDPDWRWHSMRQSDTARRLAVPLKEEFSDLASPASLSIALETLAVQSQLGGVPREVQLAKLQYLASELGALWGGIGAVADGFGYAYESAGYPDLSIAWYQKAVCAEDGSASLRAAQHLAEQLMARASPANAEQAARWAERLAAIREGC